VFKAGGSETARAANDGSPLEGRRLYASLEEVFLARAEGRRDRVEPRPSSTTRDESELFGALAVKARRRLQQGKASSVDR
jgi:hypothetical protein